MDATKIWIWLPTKRAWRQLNRQDPRLDWAYPHSPVGSVKVSTGKNRWEFVYWGETKEQAATRANQYAQKEVDELTARVHAIQARMVKP